MAYNLINANIITQGDNGTFESIVGSWGITPEPGTGLARSSAEKKSGTYSGYITSVQTGQDRALYASYWTFNLITVQIDIIKDYKYIVKGWIKMPVQPPNADYFKGFLTANPEWATGGSLVSPTDDTARTQFVEVIHEFIAGTTVNGIDIEILALVPKGLGTANSFLGAELYIDDLICEEYEYIPDVTYDDLDAQLLTTPVTTIGGTDGEITTIINSGSGDYSFSWADGPTTQNRTGVPKGNYLVTITDNLTAQVLALSIRVEEPSLIPPANLDFKVPIMNAITFSENLVTDSCTVLKTLDNELYNAERITNIKHDCYCQLFQTCDVNTIQFYSSYNQRNQLKVYNKRTGALLDTKDAVKVQSNTNISEDYAGFLKDLGGGQIRVFFGSGSFPRPVTIGDTIQLSDASHTLDYNGLYTVINVGLDDSTDEQFFTVSQAWGEPTSQVSATITLQFNEFNMDIFEVDVNFSDYPEGYLEMVIEVEDSLGNTSSQTSETINLRADHPNTHLIEYFNIDNAFGFTWTTETIQRIRIPSLFYNRLPAGERTTYRDGLNRLIKLRASRYRKVEFESYVLPPYLHEKVAAVFDCDSVKINGVEFQTDEEWEVQPITRYSMAKGSILLEQVGYMEQDNIDDFGTSDVDGGFLLGNNGVIKR